MLEDRLCSFAELGETFGMTVNQFKYLQLRDCVANSFGNPFATLLNKGKEINVFAKELTT